MMEQVDPNNQPLEIWGGVECTVVRINGTVHDQLKMNGHEERVNDVELFAQLGIKTIRYPVLWEKYTNHKELFFELHDKRLEKLRLLGITPIAGLLHHGSGPFETDLLQPMFPELLAEYAYVIAKKYPWIEYYTPVNEPLTTARFSGLYGIWYPHKKDDLSFARIFLNEMKAIILCMKRIREVNPNAKLIQTEDLSKIHSTDILKYQADLENHRRWLTYDILTGKFNPDHFFWEYFLNLGIAQSELDFFVRNTCVPDICGFNYYVTSERFLDHRIEKFPQECIGGNDFHDYADIECVRVADQPMAGVESLLREAAHRYELPIALTEIHLACTREEQMRWFYQAYLAASKLKNEGIKIRAITAWSILGSFDWNTLLQVKGDYYESGVFDVLSGKPRPTALANLITTLNKGETPTNTLLNIPGWWNRNIRIKYHLTQQIIDSIHSELDEYSMHIQPILIMGNGPLARVCESMCKLRGIPVVTAQKNNLEIIHEHTILHLIHKHNPWAIINAIGFSKIDEAELSPVDCFNQNTLLPKVLAQICFIKNIRMLTFSSDQVFNGKKRHPYLEADLTDPLNIYGLSKKIAEETTLRANPNVLIVRSSLLMNPWNPDDLLYQILSNPKDTQNTLLFSDIIISPSYLPDLINTSLDLLIDNEKGIWHLSGPEGISYYDFAKLAIGIAGLSTKRLQSIPSTRYRNHARRPAYSVLGSSSGIVLPHFENAISHYLDDFEKH